MVLVIDNSVYEWSTLLENPLIRSQCSTFLTKPKYLPQDIPQIIILQGEYCRFVCFQLESLVVGSIEATTCLLVVIFDPASRTVSSAHFDCECCHAALGELYRGMDVDVEIYFLGAHSPDAMTQAEAVFTNFHTEKDHRFHINLCCIGQLNSSPKDGSPLSQSLALKITEQGGESIQLPNQISPPFYLERMSQVHLGKSTELRLISYDTAGRQLTMVILKGGVSPSMKKELIALLNIDNDHEFLIQTSTSPQHEYQHVADNIRQTLCWLLEQKGQSVCTTLHAYL